MIIAFIDFNLKTCWLKQMCKEFGIMLKIIICNPIKLLELELEPVPDHGFNVTDISSVPPIGWTVQIELYLQY